MSLLQCWALGESSDIRQVANEVRQAHVQGADDGVKTLSQTDNLQINRQTDIKSL